MTKQRLNIQNSARLVAQFMGQNSHKMINLSYNLSVTDLSSTSLYCIVNLKMRHVKLDNITTDDMNAYQVCRI